ncbi:hypothetical protein P5673_024285 [Acropora cervicornis]|uniref:Uncharacterized protein n=1 Tax=Acropora cervicornis TaxID=6130 RepID=A0AAD9Q3X4_ACRCE|nr:hypothetical protein P5673_024285 [Acropora cervicornis]
MKTQHRLLRSDQNPVEDGLLFGTELGKSVKDLSESSKVTSKAGGRGTIAIQAERWISKVTTEKPTLPASTLVTSQGRKMEMCSGEC